MIQKVTLLKKFVKHALSGTRTRASSVAIENFTAEPALPAVRKNWESQTPTKGKNDFDHGFSDQNQQNQVNHRKIVKSKLVKIKIF